MQPERRFCPREHDTLIEGRYSSGRCKLCTREDARRRELEGRRTPLSEASQEKARVREKAWRAERPERIKGYNHRYRRTPHAQEVALQYSRGWYERNRLYANQKNAARRRGIPVASRVMVEQLLDYYGEACVYCGGQATGFDHLIPVSSGGPTDFYNLAPACGSCNSRKWSHPIWVMVGEGGDVVRAIRRGN